MMRFTKKASIGGVIALVVSASACAQVLGIDEARIDPSLTPNPTTGGMPDASTGGSGGSAGSTTADTGMPGGSGGTGGVDSGGNLTEAGSDSNDSATCREYCEGVMGFCDGDARQYVDLAQCLKICSIYPEGTIADPDGNTSSCRLKYARKARYALGVERASYCQKAGPGSDGTCGTICDGFCTLMMATCTINFKPYNFPSTGDCLAACKALKDAPPYTVSDGNLPDRNDAQCRLFHACSSVMDPDEHCEHAMGVTMCDPKFDSGRD